MRNAIRLLAGLDSKHSGFLNRADAIEIIRTIVCKLGSAKVC